MAETDAVTLEEALDGLTDAAAYADQIDRPRLAKCIADCYQTLGDAAPAEDWSEDDVDVEDLLDDHGSNGGDA